MIKIKKIFLKNYCGYRNIEFDFTDKNDNVKQLAFLYGPNGTGKTSLLDAINMCCNPLQYMNRNVDLLLSKIVYNIDYDPFITDYEKQYAAQEERSGKTDVFTEKIKQETNTMDIAAYFMDDNNNDKFVIFTTQENQGVVQNDLSVSESCLYFDADKPTSMNRFQLDIKKKDLFLDMAEMVYGFKCSFGHIVPVNMGTGESVDYYTDIVIDKYGDRIHFKRMSAGEKKIAKLVQKLCSDEIEKQNIICIDNIFMHIYFKRHAKLIDKILDTYKNKQFILTCHSETAINHIEKKYGNKFLYDLEQYKIKDLNLTSSEIIS